MPLKNTVVKSHQIDQLKKRFELLRIAQKRGESFDLCSYDHRPASEVFRDFLTVLNAEQWFDVENRWDIPFGEDVDAAHAYWAPEAVVARSPSFREALQCARYIHRCERVMFGSPWPQALDKGVIDWILSGIQLHPDIQAEASLSAPIAAAQ